MHPENKLKKIVDDFLIKKEGKNILKNITKKKLVSDGILDSLDIFTLASIIENKTKKKIKITDNKVFKKFEKYKELIKLV